MAINKKIKMSKVIKILGTGCPSCISTEKVVATVVAQLGIEATIEKVTDIMEIMNYNVMSTPAIVINEKVVFKGKVPTAEEVKLLLEEKPCCSSSSNSSCC